MALGKGGWRDDEADLPDVAGVGPRGRRNDLLRRRIDAMQTDFAAVEIRRPSAPDPLPRGTEAAMVQCTRSLS
jgi:hypothetical protein